MLHPSELNAQPDGNDTINSFRATVDDRNGCDEPVSRTQALTWIKDALEQNTCIVATTGKSGRELFEIGDEARQFYTVGSMGCVLSIGLGLALTRADQPVCVVDGDGALMMRMGPMTTVGRMAPPNLVHIVLDNGVHDSTGGQRTGSESLDFCGIAQAAGYRKILRADAVRALVPFIKDAQKHRQLAFVHFKIKPGSPILAISERTIWIFSWS